MRKKLSHFSLSASALAASLLVVACGGGGASAPNTVAGSSGFAVDDYLRDATVLCDSNDNGVSDAGESTTRTDSSGFFQFGTACAASLVVTGGTNLDTGLPFTGKLQAPPGATMVTPLTSLMAAGMTLDQISAALDLPTGIDFTQADPARKIGGVLQNPDLFRKTLAVQQLIQKTAESLASLAGAGANAALPTIYSEVAASVAASLRANPTLVSGTAMNTAAVESLVQAATARVQTSAALSTEIKNGLTVNAETLAQVVAGALVKQANAFLESTTTNAAALTSITLTVQGDDTIAGFVLQNKTVLAGAPSTETASLSTTLVGQVPGGGITPPPPSPPINGAILVSFDETTPPAVTEFGGAGYAIEAASLGGGTGNVLKISRPGGDVFAGAWVAIPAVPNNAGTQTISARVYSPAAGTPFVAKLEYGDNAGTGDRSPNEAVVAGWQTLTWTFSNLVAPNVYNRFTILPNLGTQGTGQNYLIDDISLVAAVAPPPPPPPVPPSSSCATSTEQCISFSESTIAALGFEGLIAAEVVADPVAGASNNVLKLVKGPAGAPWAGATVYTSSAPTANPEKQALTIATVGLNSSKIVTLRSYSGAPVGTKVTLKLENGVEAGQNIAAETATTIQNGWETLTFNFANLSTGVFSPSVVYNTASIFPAFSIPGAIVPLTADTTFYFDELKYAVVGSAPPVQPPAPPSGGVLASFDETTPPAVTEFGGAGYAIEAASLGGGTGNVLKISRPGGDVFAGAWVAIPAVPNNAGTQTISARVYSPAAGTPFVAKLEYGDNAGTGDRSPNEAVVAGWQTLTWTFSNLVAPNVYNRFTILPNLGTQGTGQNYLIDDITLVAGGGGGGGTTGPITFSSGFAGSARTVQGGEFGGFSGSDLDNFQCGAPAQCGGGGDVAPAVSAADSYFFYYYQTPTPASSLYAGIYVQPPGVTGGLSGTADTAGVQINGQTSIRFNFNQNPEWYQSSTNNFMVQLDMGKLYMPNGNACHIQLRQVVTPTSVDSATYTLNLSSFKVVQDCAVPGITTATALAGSPISQVSFQAAGGGSAVSDGLKTTGANLSVPAGSVYPTTLVIKGPITFQ